MASYLLDTCTFLWILEGSTELSTSVGQVFQNPENTIFLSSVSVWEIAVKYQINRIRLPGLPSIYIPQQRKRFGIESLSLEEEAAATVQKLPVLHRDPFDRMLICQAIIHNLILLTPDEHIRQYAVVTEW